MTESELDPTAARQSGARAVFFGPHGLRAGWRLLMFLALVAVLLMALVPFMRYASHGEFGSSPYSVMESDLALFAVIAAAAWIMSRFEHRPFSEYGLPPRRLLGKQFWTGALWGFVMLSFIIALMAASHAYVATGLALSAGGIVKYGLLWGMAFLVLGLFEEFSFRGYLQFTLTTGLGFWPAAAITCVVFALAHTFNPGENWVGVVEIVLIAFFLCLALRRTGNLWFAVGWHMAFDWAESFFYSTPDSGFTATGHMLNASLVGSKWLSGGGVGPEASVFDVAVTVLGILLLAKLYPDAKYPAPAVAAPTMLPPQGELLGQQPL